MKIGVYPADLEGCGHYRLIWPAFALQDEGYDVTVIPPNQRGNAFTAEIDEKTDEVTSVRIPDEYDVLIFQRVSHKYLAQAIPLMKKMGVGVVVDMDDDLENIHWSNPAWQNLHPRSGGQSTPAAQLTAQHNWKWARYAVENASLVTVSSDALYRRYVGHRGNGVVIRNYVPEHYLANERVSPSGAQLTVGWGGSMRAHAVDVPVLGNSIARIMRDGYNFRVVGPAELVKEALRLSDVPDHTGGVDLEHWPIELSRLDVGVAPLADTKFNAAKSWLKPLEYAANGVPCVISPRAEYREIHKLGIGVLADRPQEWYKTLKALLTNDELREERSERGRAAAATLTIQSNVHHWVNAWTTVPFKDVRVQSSIPVMPKRPPANVFGLRTPGKSTA